MPQSRRDVSQGQLLTKFLKYQLAAWPYDGLRTLMAMQKASIGKATESAQPMPCGEPPLILHRMHRECHMVKRLSGLSLVSKQYGTVASQSDPRRLLFWSPRSLSNTCTIILLCVHLHEMRFFLMGGVREGAEKGSFGLADVNGNAGSLYRKGYRISPAYALRGSRFRTCNLHS